MHLQLWSVGKAHDPQQRGAIEDYTRRLNAYFPCTWRIVPPPKNAASLPLEEQKRKEGEVLLALRKPGDLWVALDEHGDQWNSEGLAALLEKKRDGGTRQLVFIIGGAFGLSKELLSACQHRWSLSKLTFPHQVVRLLLAEQLYRAATILRGESYHHR